ncbi:hypothetical protein BGX33_010662 [Mortierella sp. NVP41]|nr:hypothetical protein BGX33_010662 [Mortierella sp. NVP41]
MNNAYLPIQPIRLVVHSISRSPPSAFGRSGDKTICTWNGLKVHLVHPPPEEEVYAQMNGCRKRTLSDLQVDDCIEAEGLMKVEGYVADPGSNAAALSFTFKVTEPWTFLGELEPDYDNGSYRFAVPAVDGSDSGSEQPEQVHAYTQARPCDTQSRRTDINYGVQAVNKRSFFGGDINSSNGLGEVDDDEENTLRRRSGSTILKRARSTVAADPVYSCISNLQGHDITQDLESAWGDSNSNTGCRHNSAGNNYSSGSDEHPMITGFSAVGMAGLTSCKPAPEFEHLRVGHDDPLVRAFQVFDGRLQRLKEELKKTYCWGYLKDWIDSEWSFEDIFRWERVLSSIERGTDR